jgi:diguanylate cyclase (GGDEF)-like protein
MSATIDIRGLVGQLPWDRLGVETRRRLETAWSHPESDELVANARAAVAELLSAGHLVRVALSGRTGTRPDLFLVRDTNRLLDLGELGHQKATLERRTESPPLRAPHRTASAVDSQPSAAVTHPAAPAPAPERAADPAGASASVQATTARLDAVLEAMERAQQLALGDPRVNEQQVLIDRILGLLHGYAPNLRLYAQLARVQAGHEATSFLLPPPLLDNMPFWLRYRRPGQSLWVPDLSELPRSLQTALVADGAQAVVTAVVPLLSPSDDKEEAGLLYVCGPADWPAADLLRLAHRLSAFVSRRWRCQRDVNLRVLTDSLTSIHNRAFFDSQFPLELERATRTGSPLALVIGDLDSFKTVNDDHGHQCGDVVLRVVAQQLQSRLRRIDHVCRIGGEEFACLLPATALEEAREVLSRVVGRPFRVSLPPDMGVGVLEVTMSYGAVTFPDAGKSCSELHRKADSMLYQAKELGRNRCCLWIADGRHQLLAPPGADSSRA